MPEPSDAEVPDGRSALDGMEQVRLGRGGFESGSDAYERARPGYADEAVASLVDLAGIGTGSRVLDVAAGTGKLTRCLLPWGAVCVAAEPSGSMREVFARVVPGVPVLGATAEALPVADGSVDAVVVAQAFHWFDAPVALAEMARVLRPAGSLSLIWNERDDTDPVMAELVRISRWDRHQPYPVGMDFTPAVDASRRFGPVTRTRGSFVQDVDRTTFVEQVASRSYVQVLAEPERQRLLAEVAAFAATLGESIPMPYRYDLFTATVRG